MHLTRFFLKNKFLLVTLITILILGGMSYYITTPRNEDPGFKIRTAVITSTYSGADSRQVDKYVTDKIKSVAEQMSEVEDIKSNSYEGKSVVYIDVYETYKELQPIWDKLRRKISNIQSQLPKGVTVQVNDEFGDVFGIILAIVGKDFDYIEIKDYADKVKEELLKLDDTSKVEILGAAQEAVYLYYDNSKLARYNLSPTELQNILSGTNIIAQSGKILVGDRYILVQSDDNYTDVENIKNTIITYGKKEDALKLGDILTIEKTYENPPLTITQFNGEKALIIALSMKDGGNILKFGNTVKKKINELKSYMPVGINIEYAAFQPDYVKYLTDKFTSSLFQSVIIVITLILLILGIKTGLIVGLIIPVTILGTFFVMGNLKIWLDKISLSALIIALGILVDNSIVISEGILKKIKSDIKNIENIAIQVCEKFQTPLLISTLTTSCAFLPIYLANSTVSEYTSSLFKVVACALLISWFLSITFLPYLIELFFKNGLKTSFREINISKYTARFIKKALKNPKRTVFAASIFVILSFVLFSYVPKIFFPDSDRAMFEIEFNMPEGTNIEVTKKVAQQAGEYLKSLKEVKNYSNYIGTSAPRYVLSASPEPVKSNYAMILANTKSYKTVDKLVEDVQNYCSQTFADSNTIVRKVPLGPPYDAPVEIRIFGGDENKLFEIVRDIQKKLREIKGVILVKDDWGAKTPKIKINIDEQSASRYGITNQMVAQSLQAGLSGYTVSSYWRDTTSIPVIYRLNSLSRDNINKIDSMGIYSPLWENTLPLSQFATLSLIFEYPCIIRRNGFLTVTIQGYIDKTETTAQEVIQKIKPYLNSIDFPLGMGYEEGGSVESSKKGNKSIAQKIPIAFSIILLLLIGYFNSYKIPVIILVSALMALSGANIGLLITKSDFGFMTFLAYVCLVGIATNNAVVLLDTIEKERKNKNNSNLRLVIQKSARSRITPIFLTAITTIGGMLPLWIGRDPMFSSLAVAIIFGLASSVCITLLVTPCLYFILCSKEAQKEAPSQPAQ